ncbi:MAG: hypothetical protein ACT4TC_04460 [Myxococcaceae bacterium]
MPADEQNPKVSRERLNQIASRKLAQLGVQVRPAADPQLLEGELTLQPGRVQNPLTHVPIVRARFLVWGHDHLRFLDPPLSGLRPVQFYDADALATVEQRLSSGLQRRAGALRELEAKFNALKLRSAVDAERLVIKGTLETVSDTFELLGDPEAGVRVARVIPSRGKPQDISSDYPLLKLSEFPTGLDLELHLTNELPRMIQGVDKLKEAATRGRGDGYQPLEVVPPTPGALTLGLLAHHLGPEVTVLPGAKLEVMQEFAHAGAKFRFQAAHDTGTTFRGRLMSATGEKWAERFDLTRFPGAKELVTTVLGIKPPPPPAPRAPSPGEVPPEKKADYIAPHPGEVWVMNVLVEQDDGKEIRYACTDIDGKPYGATRLLKKADFQAVFVQHGISWRLLILIDSVSGDQVSYRQLSAARQPVGAAKSIAVGILVTNFIPEAAAY